eukprot:TRINITY_DN9621_c0_g1_i1.p1 TRINITY_DN9621_c0_g1~~TRINITY_DN9621_c0_g1_i1.p1  ORF type:complete len:118 (-),score=14.81 TRINITY_DN9621_c0_g1_i1:64-417(-)
MSYKFIIYLVHQEIRFVVNLYMHFSRANTKLRIFNISVGGISPEVMLVPLNESFDLKELVVDGFTDSTLIELSQKTVFPSLELFSWIINLFGLMGISRGARRQAGERCKLLKFGRDN